MLRIICLIALIALIIGVLTAYFMRKPNRVPDTNDPDLERFLSGAARPPQFPVEWRDEPLPDGAGWRWFNPANRGDSVRMYRGVPESSDASIRKSYVIVTRNGQIIGADGKPTGETLDD